MKKLIVLSGNSVRNKQWGESAAAYFGPKFDDVYMQAYTHWETGEKDMDVELELAKLEKAVETQTVEYTVFAKSIGSILTLLAIQRAYFLPLKCVFFGMPLQLASEQLFKDSWDALQSFPVPAIAFHNDNDPISYDLTKKALAEYGPKSIRLITKVGDNHDYLSFDEYEKEIEEFLNSEI